MFYENKEDSGQFIIAKNDDGLMFWIPKDPGNSDYQAYLAWLAEQDEVTE